MALAIESSTTQNEGSLPIDQAKSFEAVIVVCVIWETRDRVAFVVENEERAWKLPGQIWVVFETMKPGEIPDVTARRWLKEELDVLWNEVDFIVEKGWLILHIEDEGKKIVSKARVLLAQLKMGTQIKGILDTSELQERGMMTVEEMRSKSSEKLRPGTLEALEIALSNESGMIELTNILHVKNAVVIDN